MSTTKIEYHPNMLSAFENGAVMDLRFRLAVELLKSGVIKIEAGSSVSQNEAAHASLNTIEALFVEGKKRGWVEDMPDHGELPKDLKHHIERSVRAQLAQNELAQKLQMEMQSGRIMHAPAGLVVNN